MKKFLLCFCLLWLLAISGSALAQTGEVDNGYWLNGGQMMHLRNGQLEPLKEPVVLPNGLTLLPNGDLVTREGIRRNLQQGQAIDVSGRILFPQTQRNGSVILVPRSAYIVERDPGRVRHRKAARPTPNRSSEMMRQDNVRPPARNAPPGNMRQGRGGPPPGKAPASNRGRIR